MAADREFRKLLVDVAEQLDHDTVKKLGYVYNVPPDSRKTGIGVLQELKEREIFSSANVQPLIQLLKEYKKSDVAEYVEQNYRSKSIVRANTMPQASPRFMRKHRSNSAHDIHIKISGPAEQRTNVSLTVPPQLVDDSGTRHLSPPPNGPCIEGGRANYFQYPEQETQRFVRGSDSHTEEPSERPRSLSDTKAVEHNKESIKQNNRSDSSFFSLTIVVSPPPSPTRLTHSESFPNTGAEANDITPLDLPSLLPTAQSVDTPAARHDDLEKDHEEEEEAGGLVMITPTAPERERLETTAQPALEREISGAWRYGSSFKRRRPKCKVIPTEHTWSLKRDNLEEPIWKHQTLHYFKCPDTVQVNVGCGEFNPYVSLLLYPFGLFEDQNKSMTLMVKITIPDRCPPIAIQDTFDLRWGVSIAATEKPIRAITLGGSKKPLKIKFKTGVEYIHKCLPHSTLKENKCERLEVRVHISN